MKYVDVDNSWSFEETGDLILTNNYLQSLNNRFKCNKEHLQIYYNTYGSDLMKMIGTGYDKEQALFILRETLNQDPNIYEYNIDDLTFTNNILTAFLTVNDLDVELIINIEDLL